LLFCQHCNHIAVVCVHVVDIKIYGPKKWVQTSNWSCLLRSGRSDQCWQTFTLSLLLTTTVPYANRLVPDETPTNSAFHPDPSCLTLRIHFQQLSTTLNHLQKAPVGAFCIPFSMNYKLPESNLLIFERSDLSNTYLIPNFTWNIVEAVIISSHKHFEKIRILNSFAKCIRKYFGSLKQMIHLLVLNVYDNISEMNQR